MPGIFFDTSKLRQVSCGECHTAALDVEGGVYFSGLLGNACEAEVFTRVAGPLRWERVAQLASGAHHLAAVTASGRCYTWGAGKDGHLGHGEAADRSEPAEVGRLAGRVVLQVSCGERCTAAVCEHTSLEAQTEFREKIEATKEMFAAASTAAMRRKAGAATGGSGGSDDIAEEHVLAELKIRGRRRPARGLRRCLRQLLRLVGLRRRWGLRGAKGGKGPPAGAGKGASAKFQSSVKAIGTARALSGTPGGAPADAAAPPAAQPPSGSVPPSGGQGGDAAKAAPANPTADMAQLALRIAELEQQLAAERAAAVESPERSPHAPGAPGVTNISAETDAGLGEVGEGAPGRGYPSRGAGGGGDLLSLPSRELQVPPAGDVAGGDRSHWLPFLWGRGEAPQTEVSGLVEANRALKEEVALLRSQLEGATGPGRGTGPHDPTGMQQQQQQQQQQQHWRNSQTPAPPPRAPPTLVSVQDVASVDYSTLVQKGGAAHALGGRRLFPESAPGADPPSTPGGAPLDPAGSPSARRVSIGGASPPPGTTWVEEVDEGVFLSLERTAAGSNILKGVRFGRDVFSQKDAEAYWDAQKVAIALKYNLAPTGARGARHRRTKSSA